MDRMVERMKRFEKSHVDCQMEWNQWRKQRDLLTASQRDIGDWDYLNSLEYYEGKLVDLAYDDNADVMVNRMMSSADRMTKLLWELTHE